MYLHLFFSVVDCRELQVKADSFFNFFEPPTCAEGDHKNEDDEEDEVLICICL